MSLLENEISNNSENEVISSSDELLNNKSIEELKQLRDEIIKGTSELIQNDENLEDNNKII